MGMENLQRVTVDENEEAVFRFRSSERREGSVCGGKVRRHRY